MRKLLLGLLIMGSAHLVYGQQTVKGKILDSLEQKTLQNAVVALLSKSDSTLYKFGRTSKNGEFSLTNVKPGPYILLITYPGFADFADFIAVKNTPVTDLGTIPMTLKSKLLDVVIIRSAAAIRLKGDTTEFTADSFRVKEGATVEDLLKRLPGFQVNSKGEISTQGQRVQKVLVDGEEFFGDDPTMATQNISARAVDKVQVFDTKTEEQNLKGTSTGTDGKTVNIKLKEDAKNGSFGKFHLGTDFDRLWDAKALYNRFVGKKKVSVYATKSNLSTGSLNWDDRQKLGIEPDFEYDELAGFYYSFSSGDEFNDWSLRGLPDSYTAGALFNNKWNADRSGINSSYRYNRLGTENNSSTLTQNLLSTGITYRNKYQHSNSLNQQHAANVKYEWKFDSLSSIKFSFAGGYKKTGISSDVYSEFLDTNKTYINRSNQLTNNQNEKKQLDNIVTYKKNFKKPNRVFIATVRYGLMDDDQMGTVQTTTNFYKNNMVDSTEIADQQKKNNGQSHTFGGKITWSEPIGRTWSAIIDYSYNRNNSVSHRNTYDKDGAGKYEVLDQAYSNNFDLGAYGHSSSLLFKFNGKKLRGSFGSGISSIRLHLTDLDSSKQTAYLFRNLTPQLAAAYLFKPQTRFFINYRGTTKQPTIDQLQPIRDNADRLNIFIGNPDLKVGFNHNINAGYSNYKTLSQTYFSANFGYNIPVNTITFYNTLDVNLGKQTYTPVNVNGNRSWNFWANMFKENDEKFGFGFDVSASGGRNHNYINEIENNISYQRKNRTNFMNSDIELSLRYGNEEKNSLEISPRIGYNISKSTLRPTQNNNYWNYGGDVDLHLILPGKFELSSECEFDMRQRIQAFATNPNQIRWKATMSKTVFNNKSGKFYLIANDILNQNKGFNRNIKSNFISEDRYQRISQYFLLKFEWSYNKMQGGTK